MFSSNVVGLIKKFLKVVVSSPIPIRETIRFGKEVVERWYPFGMDVG
jgi:hypothetical protein